MRLLALRADFGYTKAELDDIPAEDFAGPDQSFPIKVKADVKDAWDLAGHAADPDAVRAKVRAIAKRKGWEDELPDSAKADKANMGAELSDADIRAALQALLGDDPDKDGDHDDWPWVIAVYDDRFIYGCDSQTYEQDYSSGSDGNLKLDGEPRLVKAVTTYEPVVQMAAFDITNFGADDGEYIDWGPCPIFELGNYPDKGVNATLAWGKRLIARTKGTRPPLKDTHEQNDRQSVFADKWGYSTDQWLEGNKVIGKGKMHLGAKLMLGDRVPKASIEVDYKNSDPIITAIAMLNFPRVEDAEIRAAFDQFSGARHSAADADKIQAIHDHAKDLGADCGEKAAMAGARHSKGDARDIQDIHDLAVQQGATCTAAAQMGDRRPQRPATGGSRPGAKETPMSLLKKALAFFSGNAEARTAAGLTDTELAELRAQATEVDPAIEARFAERDAQMAAFQKTVDRQNAAILQATAAAFADDVIRVQFRADPAQRADLIDDYILSANADGAGGRATFGDDGKPVEGANIKRLKEKVQKWPSRKGLFSSQIMDNGSGDGIDATRVAAAERTVATAIDRLNG